MWLTDDGGATWSHGNEGIVADYLPEAAQGAAIDLCVHHLERSPAMPERLFMQFHGGVYRSDDAGASWQDIAADAPRRRPSAERRLPADPAPVLRPHRRGDDLELYFGATAGEIFGSRDAGKQWFQVASRLPAIASVRVGRDR